MNTSINFMINKDKVELLQNLKSGIESSFKVIITLGNEGPGTRRVTISTPTGNSKTVQSAKDYVHSLCFSDLELQASKHSVDRWSGEDYSACSKFDQNPREADEQLFFKNRLLEQTKKLAESKAKLESEDSSYDSEGCEEEIQHEEVHRTVSDTLQAEYADFVDSRQKLDNSSGVSLQEDEQQLSDPYFTSKIEFGLKLGYTEKQVLQALKKLGPSPDENEFLGELIKVGATSKGVSLETDLSIEIKDESSNLRHIVVDGSNVAKSHGNKEVFSCRGIQLAVDWFRKRGHKEITVFVPQWRKEASRPDAPITDQEVLFQLEKEKIVVFTPSKKIGGRRTVCYDDRYIIKLAAEVDGIVVSNDNYRDLINESPDYKKIIEERVLMYSFVNDRFMPPDDPLGRHGPNLDNFLLKEPVQLDVLARPCPYSKKCTYGNKCKFYHPERGNQPQKSVTEALMETAKEKIRNLRRDSSPAGEVLKTKLAVTQSADAITTVKKQPLNRTKSLVTGQLPSSKSPGKQILSPSDIDRSIPVKIAALNLGESYNSLSNPPGLNIAAAATGPWTGNTRRSSIPGGDPGWSSLLVGAENLTSSHCLGFSTDQGGHLALAKRLSDPDNNKQSSEVLPPNPHQKLKRLTPNDCKSPQSLHLPHYSQPMSSLDLSESRNHRQLNRQLSYTDSHCFVVPGDETVHPSLTRISSAPDSQRKFHCRTQGHMKRQNSSSDPQLNVHQEFLQEVLSPDMFSFGEVDQNPWGPPHLVRHSFQRNQQNPWLPSGLSSLSHPLDTFFPPQPLQAPPPGAIGQRSSPISNIEDPRFSLYYHLSSVFPEELVRIVMNRHPEERNPQKICSAILEMNSRNCMQ